MVSRDTESSVTLKLENSTNDSVFKYPPIKAHDILFEPVFKYYLRISSWHM